MDCGASLCVIKKPREAGGHSPLWAAEPEKKNVESLQIEPVCTVAEVASVTCW
jgi:hypothetical protein